MVLCIGTTPAAQRVMVFNGFALNAVNRAVTTLDGAAGKSINAAKVLAVLGEQPLATGFLGGDRGDYVRGVLTAKGIAHEFVTVAARTRQCITVLDKSSGMHTEFVEESAPVEMAAVESLMAVVQRRAAGCRAMIMSGTIAPGMPVDFYAACTRLARVQGALSVIDAHGVPLAEALKEKPALVKPNRLELGRTVGRELKEQGDVLRAMRQLFARGAQRVVVTAGAKPTLAFDGQKFWRITPPRITPVNPIGSGDAFTAALVWRLLRGEDLGEACRWANAAGAANALTLMPGELIHADVERLARETTVGKLTG